VRVTAEDIETRRSEYRGYADLVLAGGGVKGIAHVGAIRALEEHGYTRFQRVVGTSVGAIVGALVAAGMPASEIERHLLGFDFRKLQDPGLLDRVPLVGKPASMLLERGVYEGDAVRDWLDTLLVEQDAETFGKLRARPGRVDAGAWPLVVLATDVTRGRLARLPIDYRELYDRNPDAQRVADAVRASISIPLFYEPFKLDGSLLVDGGVLSNYAIETFDVPDPSRARWPTFGMTLLGDSTHPVLGRHLVHSVFPALRFVSGGLAGFVEDLIGTMVVGQDLHKLARDGVAKRTIRIDADDVGIVEFDIKRARKELLIRRGREAAREFLRRWDGDDGRTGSGHFPLPQAAAAAEPAAWR
jgi:NTE family protein